MVFDFELCTSIGSVTPPAALRWGGRVASSGLVTGGLTGCLVATCEGFEATCLVTGLSATETLERELANDTRVAPGGMMPPSEPKARLPVAGTEAGCRARGLWIERSCQHAVTDRVIPMF